MWVVTAVGLIGGALYSDGSARAAPSTGSRAAPAPRLQYAASVPSYVELPGVVGATSDSEFCVVGCATGSASGSPSRTRQVADSGGNGVNGSAADSACDTAAVQIRLQAGWQIIASSPDLQGSDGPFWTIESGQYVEVPRQALELGVGYWVYVDYPSAVTAALVAGAPTADCHPWGRNEAPTGCGWTMVANPYTNGFDVVPAPDRSPKYYLYSPSDGQYRGDNYLGVGQGAFTWVSTDCT